MPGYKSEGGGSVEASLADARIAVQAMLCCGGGCRIRYLSPLPQRLLNGAGASASEAPTGNPDKCRNRPPRRR